ncbi:trypsin-like peptidase domain-containing protein [Streptomyces sp. NPDC057705]|uniref:nSTAND1 domain-containing NTPase n=1 Tax=Streptomyces sp. NPDC057705 TaxID=3346222 RepID=UPI0036A1F784
MNRADTAGLPGAVAQVLDPDGNVAGAGFLVAEDLLATCAHVVRAAGSGPGGPVRLAFPHLEGAPVAEGQVLDEAWRAPEAEDVAFVRLGSTAPRVAALPLGSAAGCRGHQVRSFGFPAQAPPGGHFGFGVAGELLPSTERRGTHLQLTAANDLSTGFSGGPVLDEVTGLVIGMLTEITAPDAYERGQGIAYVTPAQVLREVLPELAEQEVCPYRGLESFTAEQARWFEGRKDAVRQVAASLAGQRRLTLLLGPSGSGKSSLVQAGVLRALAVGELPGSDRWLLVVTRPRQDLPAEIERAGLPGAAADGIGAAVTRRLAAEPGYERVLLVVDQFEELLTTPGDGGQQGHLAVADWITAAVDSTAALSVILIMRDDFYPQLAALAPELLDAAMPGLLNMPGTLSRDDLHDIITLPAQDVGLHFQPGLPEQMIADVLATSPESATTGRAPATVLPMLEQALSLLWQRRQDGYLTHEAYRRIGAVSGSVTMWADTALGRLPPEQRPVARRLLTSLVRPADPAHHVPAVRAQLPLDELRDLAAGPEGDRAVDEVLAALTRNRIITTQRLDAPPGQPVAELIHDALIGDWGTLREWISQDHRFQEWIGRTRERRSHWATGADPADLLAGTALAEGLEWSRQRHLPGDITAFLAASKERQQAVNRRNRRLIAVLGTLLALAVIAAGVAFWQRQEAVEARQAAVSRQLAGESTTLIDTNPELASLLAVQAYRTSPTAEAAESLRNAAALPLHRRLSGHAREVSGVAFSPDGHTLATAGDNAVRLRDVTTGKIRATLTGHTNPVNSVAFSPDGHTLATAGNDAVRLWDATTGTTRTTLTGHTNSVFSVAFSPDGHTVATASPDHTARLWDVTTGKVRTTLTGHTGPLFSVAFSPDGRTVATASTDQTVRLWDVTTGKVRTTLTGHTNPVNSVAFSPDGHTLASGGFDLTVRLWDSVTGKAVATLTGHTEPVLSVAFSPDGRTLATAGADHTARLWDVSTGTTRATLVGHTNWVREVAFSPDGRTLATAGNDGTVRLWNVTTGMTATVLSGHSKSVNSVAFSPDGHTVASASADHTARLWDVTTGKTRTTLTGHSNWVNAVAFSPDGHTLATAGADHTARLWDVTTGRTRTTLTGHTDQVVSVAFSPDGRILATASNDGTVRLWDVAAGQSRTTLTVRTDWVYAVAFSPDGRTFATGGNDHTVRLWDVTTGKTRSTLTGHTGPVLSVAFSPDGRTLATGSNDWTVRLWDATTGKGRTTLIGHTDWVRAVGFSPDGRTLATSSNDWTVRLWDVATRRTQTTLTGHSGSVHSVDFSPDGRTLATSGNDMTVRLQDVVLLRPAAAIENICRAVGRDLAREERTAYLPGQGTGPVCG